MPRYFFSITVALATAAALLSASSRVSAQPSVSTSSNPPIAAPKTDQENIPELQTALTALSKGDMPSALNTLKDAARKHPKLPSEYVMLYRIFGQANQGNAAKQALDRAAFEYPSDPEPWVIFAEMALNEGRLAESQLDFAKANQLLEKYSNVDRKPIIQQQALSGMAAVAERREQWKEAQARLEDFLKASPNDVVALQRLARAKFWQSQSPEQVKEVYRLLQQAKQIDLDNVAKTPGSREQLLPAAAILAQYYDMFERKPKYAESENAKKMFKYALDNSKDDLNLRAVVTVWALENGEMDLAKEQAKKAIEIEKANPKKFPDSTIGKMLSGYVAIWDKKWNDAEDQFKDVFIIAPNDFAVRNNLALALVEQPDQKKKDRALEYAYGNYQNNKDNNNALEAASTLSWIYYRLEKYDLARAAMDAVIKATGGNIANPDTATYLAHILYHDDNGHNGLKYKAKQILDTIIKSGKPFSMKPEAQKLYDLVKDEQAPKDASTTTPTASNSK
jgi:tetratricopeptide (TPR) repeat protein